MAKREPHWVKLFFRELARTGNVRLAAERAGVDFTTAYGRRKRHSDFADRWVGALGQAAASNGSNLELESAPNSSTIPSSGNGPPPPVKLWEELSVRPDGKVVKVSEARWTPRKEEAFLVELADSANVKRAARAARVSTTAVYKRRMKDGRFAAAWDAAVEAGKARLQTYLIELSDRTFDPDSLPLPEGQPRVSVAEAVSILRLKGREPSKHFADERNVNEEELKEVRERILEKLERMRERELPEQLCSRCGEAMKAEAESPAMAVAD